MDFPPIDNDFLVKENFRSNNLDTDFHDVRGYGLCTKQESPLAIIEKKYPRIYTQISLLWGKQELQNNFTRWILTDQEGRSGWPQDVYQALFELSNQHSSEFGFEANPIFGGPKDRW